MAAPDAPVIASVRRTSPTRFIILHNVPTDATYFKYYLDPVTAFTKANALARTINMSEDGGNAEEIEIREAGPHRKVFIAATAFNVGAEESDLSDEKTATMENR